MLPTRNDHVSQLFFLLTSNTRRGEMDRFFDANYTNATVAIFYKDYTHETIENSIARAKQYIAEHGADASERALPARGRADRHPRGGERRGGVVLPGEPDPDPDGGLPAELR